MACLQHTRPEGLRLVPVRFEGWLGESYFGFLASKLKGNLFIWLTFNFLFGPWEERAWHACN